MLMKMIHVIAIACDVEYRTASSMYVREMQETELFLIKVHAHENSKLKTTSCYTN